MDQFASEESYADRRKLFRELWKFSRNEDSNSIVEKPRVIRTLRVPEFSSFSFTKTKTKRLKQLRNACKKIIYSRNLKHVNDLKYAQICLKKYRFGKYKFIKRKKSKFLQATRLIRKNKINENRLSSSKLFNSCEGRSHIDVGNSSSRENTPVFQNSDIKEKKSNHLAFPSKYSKRLKTIPNIVTKTAQVKKELIKMNVINL